MPLIDMSIDELKSYQGRNPKPLDFDDYWEKALRELERIEANVTMVKADFQVPIADCYDLYFTGIGGSRIHSKCMIPKNVEGNAPAVVKFHGYTMSSDDWAELIKYAALGFVVVNMDCRGQGGFSEDMDGTSGSSLFGHIIKGIADGKEGLLYKKIFLDTAQLTRIVMGMKWVDEKRVAVTGGSQGGALTIACAALVPEVALAMPVYPFLSDYKRVWEMDLAKGAYQGITDYLRRFDPRHQRIEAFFEILGYIDLQHLAPRIKAETLMVTGLMDTICPPSTQFAIFNKIQANKDVIFYPDFGHEHLPGWANTEIEKLMTLLG